MKKKNIFWGLFFIAATLLLIASQVGSFEVVGFWSLFATVVLAAIIIQSLIYRVWFGVFLPVAILYLIYQSPLGWPFLSAWVLIIAAILVSIGMHMLIKPSYSHNHHHHGHYNGGNVSGNADDNYPTISVSFGNTTRYLHSDCMTGGQFRVSFGALEAYFGEAKLSPGGATLLLDCSFGAIKLYVPRTWIVKEEMNAGLGGVNYTNTGIAQRQDDSPELTLSGSVSMGGIEVTYI